MKLSTLLFTGIFLTIIYLISDSLTDGIFAFAGVLGVVFWLAVISFAIREATK